MLKMLKRLLLGLILLLVALAISGYIYQAIAEVSDRETFPPPGQLLRVDGSLMHIECQGEGDPTVVVEQGLGSQSVAWYDIHQQVASTTRICAYDRPGLGYSEPLPQPIRSTEVAQRLNKLLIAADIKGELILVGWSAGGVYIREFYRQFPDNVKGMVFVDSSHERQGFRLPQFEGGDDNLLRIANYLAPFGVLRISGLVESRTQGLKAPEDIKARIIALYNQSHAIQTLLNESEAFSQDVRSDNDPEPLEDLPLIVLTQGKPVEVEEGRPESMTLEKLQEVRQAWNTLQRELAQLSGNSEHIVATESGHAIHADQPELLIQTIQGMIANVRNAKQPGLSVN